MGVQFPGKKRYVTLQWPLCLCIIYKTTLFCSIVWTRGIVYVVYFHVCVYMDGTMLATCKITGRRIIIIILAGMAVI